MNDLWIKIIILAGVLLAVPIVIFIVRRQKSKQQIRRMDMPDKLKMLNELAEPFGFFYEPQEGVFTSQMYAWQREFGYERLFDHAAAGANMVIDAWPVYFDYQGRTWLIEFWKGQYGINTGGEVGIYRADATVPPHLYGRAHFEAAEDKEMPVIQCILTRKKQQLYELKKQHWWLTGFCMGIFSRPEDLQLEAVLMFEEREMAGAFFDGLRRSGKAQDKYCICGKIVYVNMDFSPRQACLPKIHRWIVQIFNKLFCGIYKLVTRPFTDTVDRMLFLYIQIPVCFRRMVKLGRNRRTRRAGMYRKKCCGKYRKKRAETNRHEAEDGRWDKHGMP